MQHRACTGMRMLPNGTKKQRRYSTVVCFCWSGGERNNKNSLIEVTTFQRCEERVLLHSKVYTNTQRARKRERAFHRNKIAAQMLLIHIATVAYFEIDRCYESAFSEFHRTLLKNDASSETSSIMQC